MQERETSQPERRTGNPRVYRSTFEFQGSIFTPQTTGSHLRDIAEFPTKWRSIEIQNREEHDRNVSVVHFLYLTFLPGDKAENVFNFAMVDMFQMLDKFDHDVDLIHADKALHRVGIPGWQDLEIMTFEAQSYQEYLRSARSIQSPEDL